MSSETEPMPTKRPLTRLHDILENGSAILRYTQGMSLAVYRQDSLHRDACERCLSRISEAAIKLGAVAEELFPHHDWRGIRDIGNILRHHYPDVLDDMIWLTITKHVPPLLIELETFLAKYPDDQETL
jgi:uncharacterized protein with HEPN domain